MRSTTFFRRLSVVPALALMGACVSVEATRIGTAGQYAPVPQDQVLVYRAESEIPAPFERIAVLWLEGDSELTSRRQMVDAARKKAGRMGANAIVLGEFKEPSTLERVAGAILDVQTEWETQVLAVRIAPLASVEVAGDSVEVARR